MDLAEGFVVGIFIRTFFYGIHLLLMAHSLRWIFFEDEGWRLRPRINGLMAMVIVLVFLFTTSSLALWITLALAALRGTLLQYTRYIVATATLDNATTLIIDAMLVLTALLASQLMNLMFQIFRCWVVSSRSWPTIWFPLVLWLANIGLFVTYVYKTATIVVFVIDAPILEGFSCCNIVINLYATSTIIYQILRVARRRHSGGSVSDLYEICRIIIECGLPYLFATIFYLATTIQTTTESFLLPTGCALNSTLNAVAFHLLVMRVGLRRIGGKRNDQRISISSLRFNIATRDLLEDHTLANSEKATLGAV